MLPPCGEYLCCHQYLGLFSIKFNFIKYIQSFFKRRPLLPGPFTHQHCREELGIAVVSHEPLIKVPHQYGDRTVVLDVHRVTRFDGQPLGMEGQPLVWVKPEDISDYPLPAADRPIVTALSLPSTYLITGEGAFQPERFLARLSAALERGRKLVQLRAQGADENAYRQLVAFRSGSM